MDWLTHLADAPVANLVFLAGLAFLAVGVFGKIAGKIEPDKLGRAGSALVGVVLTVLGLYWHVNGDSAKAQPDPPKNVTVGPSSPGPASHSAINKGRVVSESNLQPVFHSAPMPHPPLILPPHPPVLPKPLPVRYYRLQLKQGGQFLDADHCTPTVALNPGSDWENGACQLWRIVSAPGGFFRLQLKHGGQFLNADQCTTKMGLSPSSNWAGGACQLWRRVPAAGDYFRLQLKYNSQYLDADHCGPKVALNPGSTWAGGACQLWRFVPEGE